MVLNNTLEFIVLYNTINWWLSQQAAWNTRIQNAPPPELPLKTATTLIECTLGQQREVYEFAYLTFLVKKIKLAWKNSKVIGFLYSYTTGTLLNLGNNTCQAKNANSDYPFPPSLSRSSIKVSKTVDRLHIKYVIK